MVKYFEMVYLLFFFLFVLFKSCSLCSSDWPQTLYVTQSVLNNYDHPAKTRISDIQQYTRLKWYMVCLLFLCLMTWVVMIYGITESQRVPGAMYDNLLLTGAEKAQILFPNNSNLVNSFLKKIKCLDFSKIHF